MFITQLKLFLDWRFCGSVHNTDYSILHTHTHTLTGPDWERQETFWHDNSMKPLSATCWRTCFKLHVIRQLRKHLEGGYMIVGNCLHGDRVEASNYRTRVKQLKIEANLSSCFPHDTRYSRLRWWSTGVWANYTSEHCYTRGLMGGTCCRWRTLASDTCIVVGKTLLGTRDKEGGVHTLSV